MGSQSADLAKLIVMIIAGLFAGGLCGLLPLGVAKSRDRTRLGVVAFFVCLVSGGILGLLLALPVTIIFTLVLLILGRPAPRPPPPNPTTPHEPPSGVA